MRGEQAGHAPWASTSRRHHSEAHGLPGGTYVVTASSQSFFFLQQNTYLAMPGLPEVTDSG